jgi:hypothetical protein
LKRFYKLGRNSPPSRKQCQALRAHIFNKRIRGTTCGDEPQTSIVFGRARSFKTRRSNRTAALGCREALQLDRQGAKTLGVFCNHGQPGRSH